MRSQRRKVHGRMICESCSANRQPYSARCTTLLWSNQEKNPNFLNKRKLSALIGDYLTADGELFCSVIPEIFEPNRSFEADLL